MAQRTGAGMWVAITFLALAAVAFATLYFMQQTDLLEVQNKIRNIDVTTLANVENNDNAKELINKQIQLADQIAEQRNTISTLNEQIAGLEKDIETETRRAEEKIRLVADLEASIATKNSQIEENSNKYSEDLQTKDKALEDEVTQLNNEKMDLASTKERAILKNQRLEERQQAIIQNSLQRIRHQESEIVGLRQSISKKEQAIAKRESSQLEEYDGKVIEVDVGTRLAVIDLGRVNNIHRGMRFDVIRRVQNKWKRMGALEITKVDTSTATAVILEDISTQRICLKCGFVAHDPEARFCPYCSSGENNDRVEFLTSDRRNNVPVMDKMDPIIKGDFITNPFFSKKHRLRFVVSGEPVHYSTAQISSKIKDYGGLVQDKIDVDTDYLVLGRIPDDSTAQFSDEAKARLDAYKKTLEIANRYGIPIMREVDLFNYLRN